MPGFGQRPGKEIRRPLLDPYTGEQRRVIAERMEETEHDRLSREERAFTLDGPGRRGLEMPPDWKAGEPDIRDASPLLRSRLEAGIKGQGDAVD